MVFTAVYMKVRGRLPEQVATHFGADGADGFTSRTAVLFIGLAIIVLLGAGFALGVVADFGRTDFERRMTPAIGCGTAVVIGYCMTAMVVANVDAVDAAGVTFSWALFGIGVAAGLVAGGAAWWVTERAGVR
ncbi:DUF1648 domain-containing protein [Streptomyces sp. N35]|uniref:DUF1648 domain-containing protein n=1 Tax=Streptomyces sp. N35 TaxID=2795730 RepID=UPI0018F6110B|nr:DUF1648 domain-containing protein [Streptomyces sp. N35]